MITPSIRTTSPVQWLTDDQFRTAPILERMVAIADSYTGVAEHPKGSNLGSEVERFQQVYGLRGVPWCACFVGNNALEAGFMRSEIGPSGSVADWVKFAKARKLIVPKLELVLAGGVPKRGWLGFYLHEDMTGHIYQVLGPSNIRGGFRTIEGNTNDDGSREGYEVCKRTRTINSMKTYHQYGFIKLHSGH